MRRRLVALTTVGALTACLAVTGATTAWGAPPAGTWTSIDLGTLGGTRTDARDVNVKGQVVGQSQTADGAWHAFLWEDGVMTDLTPGARQGMAVAINDRGEIAGFGITADGTTTQALRWYRGTTTVLAEEAWATEVNERGQVGGVADHVTEGVATTTPFVWTSGTSVDVGDVPYPDAWPSSGLLDLNRGGAVLGRTETHEDRDVTYVWRDGEFTFLEDATGPVYGLDLNDRGHVAGRTWSEDGLRDVAALWRDGAVERLGGLAPGSTSVGEALNEHDVVVGWTADSAHSTTDRRGFVWDDGTVQPVGVVQEGWSEASEVNDRGQVAGRLGWTGQDGASVQQAYAWTAGTLTPLGGEHEGVLVTDQNAKGLVLVDQYDGSEVRAALHVPPRRRS